MHLVLEGSRLTSRSQCCVASDVVERMMMSFTVSLRVRGATVAGGCSSLAAGVWRVLRVEGKMQVRKVKTSAGGAMRAP